MSLRGHLRIDAQMMYIGSTSLGVTKREYNRCSKIRQVHRGRLPKAELAVQYWSDSGTYFHYCTLLLQRCPDYRTAWAAEQSLIQTWQPSLNYPFICRSFINKATGVVPTNKRPHLTVGSDKLGRRLYKKLRRHLPGRHPAHHLIRRQKAWEVIYDLASNTLRSFETAKLIRSTQYDSLEVLALHRMCNHLEQPWKQRAKSIIAKALKFKGQSIPPANRSYCGPFLAHSSFTRDLRTFLQSTIFHFRHALVPFHLPSPRPRELAPTNLSKLLTGSSSPLHPPPSPPALADGSLLNILACKPHRMATWSVGWNISTSTGAFMISP